MRVMTGRPLILERSHLLLLVVSLISVKAKVTQLMAKTEEARGR